MSDKTLIFILLIPCTVGIMFLVGFIMRKMHCHDWYNELDEHERIHVDISRAYGQWWDECPICGKNRNY